MRFCYALAVIFSFPLQLFPVFEEVDRLASVFFSSSKVPALSGDGSDAEGGGVSPLHPSDGSGIEEPNDDETSSRISLAASSGGRGDISS